VTSLVNPDADDAHGIRALRSEAGPDNSSPEPLNAAADPARSLVSGWSEGSRGGEAEDGMKGRAAGSDSDCENHPQNFVGQRAGAPDYWTAPEAEASGLVHAVQRDHSRYERSSDSACDTAGVLLVGTNPGRIQEAEADHELRRALEDVR